MKICILIPQYIPIRIGGSEIATSYLAKHLVNKGHEVIIITSKDKELPGQCNFDGYKIYRLKVPEIKFIHLFYLSFWIKVFFKLIEIKPHIVICQGIFTAVPAVPIKYCFKTPYIVWGQGSDVYLNHFYSGIMFDFLLSRADKVLALTEDMKKRIQRYGNDIKIQVIPNGIDLQKFSGLTREVSRAKLNIRDRDFVIIFVGRLHPIKGLGNIIRAMPMIIKGDNDVKLWLVGDGPERKRLENMVSDMGLGSHVFFVGRVANECIPLYISASDVLVLPSLSEGLPVVLLEAMACGLPIVASKVGGIPEIINEGENGFLVEPGDYKDLADKILLLRSNSDIKRKISENNLQKSKRYDWQEIVERLQKILEKILEKKNYKNKLLKF